MHEANHQTGMLLLALVVLCLIGLALLIEVLIARRHDHYLAQYEDFEPPISEETRRQRDDFWQVVMEAELRRAGHLNESEAAAIARQHQQHDHQPVA
jgi:hypothetical protein